MKLSVIIPVFRGGDILKDLFNKIHDTLAEKYDYEVLFICDGCDSRSQSVLKKLNEIHSDYIKIFYFARNYGQHRAIQFGFGKATGDFIITMDEDLQHDPEDILKLAKKQKEGDYDIVYGKFNSLRHKGMRNKISMFLRKILKHFIPTLFENYSPYRLIKWETAIRISAMVCPYTFIDDFLSRITRNIAFIDISHHKRPRGESSYTFLKMIKHGVQILLAYSRLIQWLLAISLIFIILSLLMFIVNAIKSKPLNSDYNFDIISFTLLSIGLVFILLSFIGAFINHRNIIINTRPVVLFEKDTC